MNLPRSRSVLPNTHFARNILLTAVVVVVLKVQLRTVMLDFVLILRVALNLEKVAFCVFSADVPYVVGLSPGSLPGWVGEMKPNY